MIRTLDILAYIGLVGFFVVPAIVAFFSLDGDIAISAAFFLAIFSYVLSQNLKLRYFDLSATRKTIHLVTSVILILYTLSMTDFGGLLAPDEGALFASLILYPIVSAPLLAIMWFVKRSGPTKPRSGRTVDDGSLSDDHELP